MTVGTLLTRRAALALVTLWLLSLIVFAGGELLPGDVGRAILGPLADAGAVAHLDHQLGVDRPFLQRYFEWLGRFITGDLSLSYSYHAPVAHFIWPALARSLELGLVAFVLVVPLGIAGGVWAALHAGRLIDRIVSLVGLALASIPEFVTGIVLIIIFGIWLKVLPVSASWPAHASIGTQLHHLLLPALPLVLVLFGYLARMTRSGTLEALAADYTRTAVLKGLPERTVLWRHVLRNALLPTIAVVATQTGYLMGGLVVIETLFRYPGIGGLIFAAARDKDFPMLEAGVLVIGVIYPLAALAADVLNTILNPRIARGRA